MIGIGKFGSMYLAQVPNIPWSGSGGCGGFISLEGKIQTVKGRLGGGKAFG